MKVDDRFIVQKMGHVNVIQIITSFATLFLDLRVRKANQQCNSSVKGHSTVFCLLWNLHSESFGVAYLKIYATEQNNTTSEW